MIIKGFFFLRCTKSVLWVANGPPKRRKQVKTKVVNGETLIAYNMFELPSQSHPLLLCGYAEAIPI